MAIIVKNHEIFYVEITITTMKDKRIQFSARPRPVDLSQENRGYVNILTIAKALAWISVGAYCVGSMISTHTVSTGPGAAVLQAVDLLKKVMKS